MQQDSTDYSTIFSEICNDLARMKDRGKVATYIPELGKVDPKMFGVHLSTMSGEHFSFGDSNKRFSIQSISKVLTLNNRCLIPRYGMEIVNLIAV